MENHTRSGQLRCMPMVYPEIVIAGCGNPLYADDGFGPAVAEELQIYTLPDNVRAVDAGTSAPQFLFPMLDPQETKKLIVVDITDFGGQPGSVIWFRIDDLPAGSIHDAHADGIIESLLQIRSRFDVTIIGCQPKRVTNPVIEIGLSEEVMTAIPVTVKIILDLLRMDYGSSLDPLRQKCTNELPDQSSAGSGSPLYCTRLMPDGARISGGYSWRV